MKPNIRIDRESKNRWIAHMGTGIPMFAGTLSEVCKLVQEYVDGWE